MTYLDPPPMPAPVIVQKDVGGLVSEYMARTEQYRAEGREVRLHECRSACTLALSLPNVCVYPTSVLKFHKAYDWNTKIRDEAVSAELMAAYPASVQARLGALTRDYQVLTGVELIALGVRDCTAAPQIQIARARPTPAAPAGQTHGGGLIGAIAVALRLDPPAPPSAVRQPEPARASVAPAPFLEKSGQGAEETALPLPPRRPVEFQVASATVAEDAPPLPPKRPADIDRNPGLPGLIEGAQPVMPWGVLSYSAFGR